MKVNGLKDEPMRMILAHLAQIETKIDALSDRKVPHNIDAKQAAKMLGTTEGNIHVMVHRLQIPHKKHGRRTLFEFSEVDKLLTSCQMKDELLEDYE